MIKHTGLGRLYSSFSVTPAGTYTYQFDLVSKQLINIVTTALVSSVGVNSYHCVLMSRHKS
jgi:hypothetical protein